MDPPATFETACWTKYTKTSGFPFQIPFQIPSGFLSKSISPSFTLPSVKIRCPKSCQKPSTSRLWPFTSFRHPLCSLPRALRIPPGRPCSCTPARPKPLTVKAKCLRVCHFWRSKCVRKANFKTLTSWSAFWLPSGCLLACFGGLQEALGGLRVASPALVCFICG